MLKILKWLVYLFGLVVVLAVVAGVALVFWFDPNDYKNQIAQMVEARTHRNLTIQGDITFTFYPWLGLKTGEMALANAQGFGPEPFARVEAVKFAVKLLPLLERRIETRTITLHGLELNLERNAAGKVNWEDLVPKEEKSSGEPATEKASSQAGGALAAVVVSGVQIEDAELGWHDRLSGERYVFSDVDLRTDALSLNEPFRLDLSLNLADTPQALSGRLVLDTLVHPNPDAQLYRLENVNLKADLQGEALPHPLNVTASTDIQTDLKEGTLRLDDLRLAALGLTAKGAVKGTQILADPRLDGTLAVEPFNPRELFRALGEETPETASAEVLTRAKVNLAFAATANALDLEDLKVELDQSTLTGTARVRNFAAPRIGFDLTLDAIDLDAYLPPEKQAEAPPATPAEAAAGAAAQLPLDTLRKLNLDGSLKIGSLKVSNLRTRDVAVKIQAADGRIRLDPLNAQLYDGQYTGTVLLDARGDSLRTQLQWDLAGIQAGPLLQDLTGEGRLLGKGNVHAEFAAAGADAEAVQRSLDGSLSFSFTDGAVKGINIPHMIRAAKAALEGRPAPEAEYDQTDFSELSASFRIQDGVIRNDDLQAKSPLLRVEGDGRLNLPKDAVDYTVTAFIVGTLQGQGGKELQELKGFPIPIRFSGSLSEPSIGLDLQKILTEKVKAEAQAKLEEKTQELEKKLGETLEKQLGDKLDDSTKEQIQKQLPGALKELFGR